MTERRPETSADPTGHRGIPFPISQHGYVEEDSTRTSRPRPTARRATAMLLRRRPENANARESRRGSQHERVERAGVRMAQGRAYVRSLQSVSRVGAVTVNVVALAVLLGLFAIITGRALGPSDRGIVVVFMTLSSMLMVLGSFGVNTFARVHLIAKIDPLPLDEYIGLVAVLAVVQIIVAFTLGGLAMWATHSLTNVQVLLCLAVYSCLNVICYLLREGLYSLGLNARASRGDPLAAAVQLTLVLVIWRTVGLSLDPALWMLILGQAVGTIFFVAQYRKAGLSLRPTLSSKSFRHQIRGGLPALLTNLGQTFIFRADRLILGFLASTAAVGIYSVAVTMTEVLLLIPLSISQAVFHGIASGALPPSALRALRLISIVISSSGGVALGLFCPWLIGLLFGPEFRGAVTPLRILLVGSVAMGSYLVDIATINALGRLGVAGFLTLLGFLLIGALDLALIPPYGMNGAALASTVAYVAMAMVAALRRGRLSAGRSPEAEIG